MKVLPKALLICCAMLSVTAIGYLGFYKTADGQVKNLTDGDSGKTLTITTGSVFTLTLPDHGGGGYRFNRSSFDNTILHLQSHSEAGAPANSAIGHPGTAVWKFIAVKKGRTKLVVTESRPWRQTDTIINFQNLVLVK
jgi:predicted secreted protein